MDYTSIRETKLLFYITERGTTEPELVVRKVLENAMMRIFLHMYRFYQILVTKMHNDDSASVW